MKNRSTAWWRRPRRAPKAAENRHPRGRSQQRERASGLHRRRRRGDRAPPHDQGRRRRAHAREDHGRGGAQVRVHLRQLEARAGARQVSGADRGDPDGAQLCRARSGEDGRSSAAAPGLHHGQRQRHPRLLHGDDAARPAEGGVELNQIAGVWRTAFLRAARPMFCSSPKPPASSRRSAFVGPRVFLLSLAAFASAASCAPPTPAAADRRRIRRHRGAASAAVTAFALSYGLLQVVCGPLGDRYGLPHDRRGGIGVGVRLGGLRGRPSLDALVAARRVGGDHRRVHPARARVDRRHRRLREAPAAARASSSARWPASPSAPRPPDGSASISAGARFSSRWRRFFSSSRCCSFLKYAQSARRPRRRGRGAIRQSLQRMPRLCSSAAASAARDRIREGLFIFGALAFVAIYLQRRYLLGPGPRRDARDGLRRGRTAVRARARRAVRRLGERGLATLGGPRW